MPKAAKKRLFLAVLTLGLLASCAHNGRSPRQQPIPRAMQQLEAGDFQEAIDSYRSALERNPEDKNLAASFAAAVEEIKRVGDNALGRRNYSHAEKTYRLLLKNFPAFGRIEKSLSFTRNSLTAQLKKIGQKR